MVPDNGSPQVSPASTLLVESNPASSAARAAFIPASVPWLRRRPNSASIRPSAASTDRAALLASTVCPWSEVEQRGLDQLGLEDRRRHLQQRLVGEHQGAFGHRPHLARESEAAKVVEEGGLEPAERAEVVEPRVGEAERAQVLEGILSPAATRNPRPAGSRRANRLKVAGPPMPSRKKAAAMVSS